MTGERVLSMWVVYERPKDYPTGYVVRRHDITREGSYATQHHTVHATLGEAREAVPKWTMRMERDPNDEPQIVEVWL